MGLVVATLAIPSPTRGQAPSDNPVAADLTVADRRLAGALSRLLAGSPTAAAVIAALVESRLPVSVGTHGELARGNEGEEPGALLPEAASLASSLEPQVAWVAFRVAMPEPGTAESLARIERAWVVVDVDLIEALIRATGGSDVEARLEDDLVVALGHELVAHVGSVARTRRVEDFCDDPPPGVGAQGRFACSLRVENVVRRELNESFQRKGARRLPERRTYALEVMNFARGR
jgi:hypothetical protein